MIGRSSKKIKNEISNIKVKNLLEDTVEKQKKIAGSFAHKNFQS